MVLEFGVQLSGFEGLISVLGLGYSLGVSLGQVLGFDFWF